MTAPLKHMLLLGLCAAQPIFALANTNAAAACTECEPWAVAAWQCPQHGGHGKIDPEELRKKQEAFIIKEAGLTPSEAAFFFPSFRELKHKQRAIRKAIRSSYQRIRKERLAEKDCDKLLQEIKRLEKANTEVEITYYDNWRKKLSASKIIKILDADRRFSKQVFDRHVQ